MRSLLQSCDLRLTHGKSTHEIIREFTRYRDLVWGGQRFSHPDWSIADLWIAKELLSSGIPPAEVKTILQLGSPDFPRHHAAPEDYLHRTLARAGTHMAAAFPARPTRDVFP